MRRISSDPMCASATHTSADYMQPLEPARKAFGSECNKTGDSGTNSQAITVHFHMLERSDLVVCCSTSTPFATLGDFWKLTRIVTSQGR